MSISGSQYLHSNGSMNVERLLDKAWQHINQQDVPKAKSFCRQLNVEYASNAQGWFATSFLAFQLGDFQAALETISKSIEIEPSNQRWLLHKAHCLLSSGQKGPALTLSKKLLEGHFTDVDFCAEFALVLNKLSCFDEAEKFYMQAIDTLDKSGVKDDVRHGQLYFNLASIQRYQGAIDKAERSLNKAISLNNKDYEAYLLRSSLKTQSENDNHIDGLKRALEKGIQHPLSKAQVCYALAKELEDIGEHGDSFHFLQVGASGRRQHMRYDVKQDIETIHKIIETFDESVFQKRPKGCDNEEAIFILGLPRTGSTLVERIIGNHESVFSAGELNNFALSMMEIVKQEAKHPPSNKSELVAMTKRLDFEKLGLKYIHSTRPETGNTACFIDKLPLNSLYAGLIHLALPKAKLVHVTRHPMDTCYAMYKQLFTQGYPFSYDLKELAQYYVAHHKLMAHWHKVMPGVIYDISYERLITNPDNESQSLVEYCGLEWQSQCIDFQKNKAPSTTASATQVRQKIYQKSRGKWKHYEQQLAPVKVILEQAGIDCS